jgi:hypothetical protein
MGQVLNAAVLPNYALSGSDLLCRTPDQAGLGLRLFAVAWTNQDSQTPEIIDGSYFSPSRPATEFNGDMNYYASAGQDREYHWPHATANLSGKLIRAQSTSNSPTHSWRQTAGATARIAASEDLSSSVIFPATGDYTFELTVTEGGFTHRDSVTFRILEAQDGVSGFLTRSVWFDISGREVEELREADPNLAFPHFEDLLPGAETPQNWADYYGTRLAGFVTVPKSGNYRFWVASDDYSEIWFDAKNGTGSQRIAHLRASSGFRNWDRRTSQKSDAIALQAGIAYPISILHKEYGGGDFLSVAFEGPATNGRELLSRGFLSPDHDAPIHNPEMTITAEVDRALLWPEDSLVLAGLVYDLNDGPQPLSYSWSTESAGVAFEAPESPVTQITFLAPGLYEISISATDGANTASDSVFVVVEDPLVPNAGGLLREAWVGISGWRLSDLTGSQHYGESPDFTDILPSFEAPTDWADNYGQRFSGFLQVPSEGDYKLLVSSDDQSEVWFNPNGTDPSGASRVAFTDRATGRHRWDRYATQQSAVFRLVPEQRYFLQALHKEGTGMTTLPSPISGRIFQNPSPSSFPERY